MGNLKQFPEIHMISLLDLRDRSQVIFPYGLNFYPGWCKLSGHF
jgi:hypothetical protein